MMQLMAAVMLHLLVDGSNVLHAWPETAALLRRDKNAARARLIDVLASVHGTRECRITIVFDGSGSELAVERPIDDVTFSVLTTPSGVTADEVIEQLVTQGKTPGDCTVVTADRAVRQSVEAAGGSSLPPADLAKWIERAGEQALRQARRITDSSNRRTSRDRGLG